MITFYSWARSAARPAALDRPGRPSPAWLHLSLVILGLQIAAGLLIPGDGLVTCAGYAAQCVLAASFAGRRATGDRLRWHWLTLAAALACWAGGYVAIGVEENLVGPNPATGLFNDVLSMLKAAPFLLLLTAGLDASASRPLLRLDLAAVLIFALTAAALILGDPFGSGAREASVSIRDVRDIENIALAVLALATQRVQRRTADRALYRAVAWLLGGYLVSATLLNHVIIERLPDPRVGVDGDRLPAVRPVPRGRAVRVAVDVAAATALGGSAALPCPVAAGRRLAAVRVRGRAAR